MTVELDGRVAPSALALRATAAALRRAVNPNVDRMVLEQVWTHVEQRHAAEAAQQFHAAWDRHRDEREAAIRSAFAGLGHPETIVTMLFCRNFARYFRNWVRSCDANAIAIRDRTLVFTLDEEAEAAARREGVPSVCLAPGAYPPAGGSRAFGDTQFRVTMGFKNGIIDACLKLGARVLFQDVDLVWLRDPIAWLDAHASGAEFRIMYDGPNYSRTPPYGNSGFFFLRPTDAVRSVFETALRNTKRTILHGHQGPLISIAQHYWWHNLLGLEVLPEDRFLNGHLFNLETGLHVDAGGNWREAGVVVHYSWTGTHDDKLDKLRRFGLSYLSPWERPAIR
ncbi:MAG: putative nucleotide-diphospho-sugar transferase [Pseudomonadota bacterium]